MRLAGRLVSSGCRFRDGAAIPMLRGPVHAVGDFCATSYAPARA